jgi:DNA invertase Pin-like site-specific DNA recombinase
MFQMCGVFAEFERGMIRERVAAGLNRAKAAGKVLGRPKTSSEVEDCIRQLHDSGKGMGKLKIAKTLGIGVSVVQRVLAA